MSRFLLPVRNGYAALLLPAVVGLLILFVYPMAEVLKASLFNPDLGFDHFQRIIDTPIYSTVLLRTLRVALVVTALCFLLGYPVAYFLAHARPAIRPYLILLVLLPFWMSILIRTYTWIALLGRNGIVNSVLTDLGWIEQPLRMLYTTGAIYVAMAQILLPIMILSCYSVMVEIDEGLIKAARVLGAGPVRAFLWVYLPLSAGGASTGAIIIFILSMGFFITPALIGGRQDLMIGNLIEVQVTQMVNLGFASALGLALLATTVIIVLVFRAMTQVRSVGRAR